MSLLSTQQVLIESFDVMSHHVSTAVWSTSTVLSREATVSDPCDSQICSELGQFGGDLPKRQHTAEHILPYLIVTDVLQIGTYSALIGDQALFCSSKISKALPSVFSSSALHSPLLSAHCDLYVCWDPTSVLVLSLPTRMFSAFAKSRSRVCSPSLHT